MSIARYIVLEHDNQWKINLNNRYFGPFPTRDAAVASAIETAEEADSRGFKAIVMVLVDQTTFETVWESGLG